MAIKVNLDPQQEGTVRYGDNQNTIPSDQAEVKAAKYDMVLGENSPGIQSIKVNLENGYEDRYRALIQQNKELNFEREKVNMVNNLLSSGEEVTPVTRDFIYGMSQTDASEVYNSPNIFETEYAKKFFSSIVASDENKVFDQAQAEDAEQANKIADRFEWGVARNEITNGLIDDVERRLRNTSLVGKAWDFVEQMVPLSDIRFNDLLEKAPTTAVLPGSNLKQQYLYLNSLPPDEFRMQLTKAYNDIAEKNLYMAAQFLQGVNKFSGWDKGMTNAFFMSDFVDLAGGAIGVIKGVKRLTKSGAEAKALVNQMSSALKASASRRMSIQKVAAATGNFKAAAVAATVKDFRQKLVQGARKDVEKLADNVTSLTDPQRWMIGSTHLSSQQEQALIKATERRASLAGDILTDVDRVARVDDARMAVIAANTYEELINGVMKSVQSSILDLDNSGNKFIRIPSEENPVTNTEAISIALGKQDGSLFASEKAAKGWATKRLNMTDYTIEQQGNGYYINVRKDLPENLDNFKNIPMSLNDTNPVSFANSIIGIARSPEHTLSQSNTFARKQVVHGTQKLFELYREMAQPLADLSKDELKDMKYIFSANRDFVDKVTGERGMFYNSISEFEQAFHSKFNRLPSEKQIDAYNAYVQMNDLDFVLRDAGWQRDKIRIGLSNFNINYRYITNQPNNVGSVSSPLEFEGKVVSEIPFFNERPTTVMFYDNGVNATVFKNTKYQPQQVKQLIEDYRAKGYQLIQVADANLRVPNHDGEKGIGFIVAKDFKNDRISVINNYRPGGHVMNRYEHYAKQGRIEDGFSGKYYTGDTAIFSAPTEKELKKRVDALNKAREALKANKTDKEIEDIIGPSLGMDVKDFKRLFQKRKNAKGETVPALNLNIPVVGTKSGQRTTDVVKYNDMFPNEFNDLVNNPHNLYTEIDRTFSGERDSSNLPVIREENNMVMHIDDGELLDPFETLSRAAYNVMDLQLKRDYTLKSSNDWIEQFSDILEPSLSDMSRNPIKNLYNPVYKRGADKLTKRNAELARKQIIRFMGALNREETTFEYLKAKVANVAFETGGTKGLKIAENWLLPAVKDPLTFTRSIAFHAKLGLFNAQQFFVQAQNAITALAISPVHGFKGTMVYPLMRAAQINPAHLDHLSNIATKLGWKKDEFLEMYDLFDRSGWGIVAGDVGVLDDIANPKIFESTTGKVLDAGAAIFAEGEKVGRLSAFATAYREIRAQKPVGTLSRLDRAKILDRADNLTINMSAANNAVWQRGMAAIPMQFLAYQARLTEAYLGKKLTAGEKARMFAVNSLMYGVPTAVGGAVGVWPVYESIKSYLVNNNIDYNEGALEGIVQGLPGMIFGKMGMEIDPGSRYGAGGATVLRDIMTADTPLAGIAEAMIGPSGNMMTDLLGGAVAPGLKAMFGLIDGNSDVYDLLPDMLIDATKEISSVNNGLKLWYAVNTGKWLTKKGATVDDVSANEALFMAMTGIQTDRISDTFTKIELLNDAKGYRQEVQDLVLKEFRRAALHPEAHQEYMQKAWAHANAGGLTPKEFMQVIRRALRELGGTQVDSVYRKFEEMQLQKQQQGNQ